MTREQANLTWESKVEAEVRSLYFAALTADYARYKQIITGLSFFLSSGAAAIVIAKEPMYSVPMSIIVAVLTAYSIATGLDRRIATFAKLHAEWNALSDEYDRLWHHWEDADSEKTLYELLKRGRDASQLASTDAPYKKALMDRTQKLVFSRYQAVASA